MAVIAILVTAVAGAVLWFKFAPAAQVTRVLLTLERRRAGLTPKALDISGFRIAYLEGGRGEPLILVHGFGGSKDNWTVVSRYLTQRFRVIALDVPGFGESAKPADRPYHTRDQVAYLHAFVGALGLTSFHLGGNSMGGRIAGEYAAAYPQEVKSLWLLAPGGVQSAQPSEIMQRPDGPKTVLLPRTSTELDRLFAQLMTTPPYIPRPVKRVLLALAVANHDLHERIFDEITAEWMSHPLERIVAGVGMPTRIVWGERDRLLDVSGAEILHRVMPASSVLILPAVGHIPMIEAPAKVAKDYLAFAQSAPPR